MRTVSSSGGETQESLCAAVRRQRAMCSTAMPPDRPAAGRGAGDDEEVSAGAPRGYKGSALGCTPLASAVSASAVLLDFWRPHASSMPAPGPLQLLQPPVPPMPLPPLALLRITPLTLQGQYDAWLTQTLIDSDVAEGWGFFTGAHGLGGQGRGWCWCGPFKPPSIQRPSRTRTPPCRLRGGAAAADGSGAAAKILARALRLGCR